MDTSPRYGGWTESMLDESGRTDQKKSRRNLSISLGIPPGYLVNGIERNILNGKDE